MSMCCAWPSVQGSLDGWIFGGKGAVKLVAALRAEPNLTVCAPCKCPQLLVLLLVLCELKLHTLLCLYLLRVEGRCAWRRESCAAVVTLGRFLLPLIPARVVTRDMPPPFLLLLHLRDSRTLAAATTSVAAQWAARSRRSAA